MIEYTGVFITEKEIEQVKHAVSMPVIKIGNHSPKMPEQVCHRLALEHGLPDIKGYYGCDLRTGEIVKMKV